MWRHRGLYRLRHRGETANKFVDGRLVWPSGQPGPEPLQASHVLLVLYALLQLLALTALAAYAFEVPDRNTYSALDHAICGFPAQHACDVSPAIGLLALANIFCSLLLVLEFWRRQRIRASLREITAQYQDCQKLIRLGRWTWHPESDRFQLSSSSRHLQSLIPAAGISLAAFAGIFLSKGGSSVENVIREAAQFKRSFSKECRIANSNDTVEWVEITGHCTNGQDCSGYVIDITLRKQLARDRDKLREQESFYAQASSVLMHELKQPLAAILGNAEAVRLMLESDRLNLAEIGETINDIIQEDGRAKNVMTHMRLFFAHDGFSSTIVLQSIIHDSTKIMHAEFAKRNIELIINSGSNIPYVTGDPVRIQQVLLNLISNAIDAMEGGDGHKRLSIDLSFNNDSNFVTLSVSDTGTGISDAVRRHLFSAYFTSKSKGTGLGLYICRVIIAAHGGRISAENNPEGGATFHIHLPKGVSDILWHNPQATQSS